MKSTMVAVFILASLCSVVFSHGIGMPCGSSTDCECSSNSDCEWGERCIGSRCFPAFRGKRQECYPCDETTNCGIFGHCVNGCCEGPRGKRQIGRHCDSDTDCGFYGHCVQGHCDIINRGKRQEGHPCKKNSDCHLLQYCADDHKCHDDFN